MKNLNVVLMGKKEEIEEEISQIQKIIEDDTQLWDMILKDL